MQAVRREQVLGAAVVQPVGDEGGQQGGQAVGGVRQRPGRPVAPIGIGAQQPADPQAGAEHLADAPRVIAVVGGELAQWRKRVSSQGAVDVALDDRQLQAMGHLGDVPAALEGHRNGGGVVQCRLQIDGAAARGPGGPFKIVGPHPSVVHGHGDRPYAACLGRRPKTVIGQFLDQQGVAFGASRIEGERKGMAGPQGQCESVRIEYGVAAVPDHPAGDGIQYPGMTAGIWIAQGVAIDGLSPQAVGQSLRDRRAEREVDG
ncbi:hypothetical protein KCV01_g4877, partial [Aureobasidium melanogenum]